MCSDAGILTKVVPPAPPRLCVSQAWDGDRGATNPHPRDLDELGTHTLAAPTYAGWLHPGIRGAVVSFPCKSSRMLQCSIAEDIEPSLGHGRDLLPLGCSQVLQKASSARWGGRWLRAKQGGGQQGQPANHAMPHCTASPTAQATCTGHTASGTPRIQPPLSPAERGNGPMAKGQGHCSPMGAEGLCHQGAAVTSWSQKTRCSLQPSSKSCKTQEGTQVGT